MSIFVNKETKVLVQGITGQEGKFHTRRCIDYGTNVVAGVTPGRGGNFMDNVPIFNDVLEAKKHTKCNTSMIFVPPKFASDAIMESIDAEIDLIVCITEGIPLRDMMKIKKFLLGKTSRLIGPNCPGIISPGLCKVGIMPGIIHKEGGEIGVISRSGTLTYEVVNQLTNCNIGQTTCVGIGGDSIIGTDFVDCLREFQLDNETKGIVLVGEIGGSAEEIASVFIKENVTKPVVGFIAGITAPQGKRMGHAGAIVTGGVGTAQEKIKVMEACSINVCRDLGYLGEFCSEIFKY